MYYVWFGVEYYDVGVGCGIQEIMCVVFVLWFEFCVDQQVYFVYIIEQIKFGIQLLQVFDEQFVFCVYVIQYCWGIDQIEGGVGDCVGQWVVVVG